MSDTAVVQKLLNYVRAVLSNPSKATLEVSEVPEEFMEFAATLKYLGDCIDECFVTARSMSQGNMDCPPLNLGNRIATPLKTLQTNLKHVAYQAKQIATGDFNQRKMFMSELTDAFNAIIEQSAETHKQLQEDLDKIKAKNDAIEQYSMMIASLIQYIPQEIMVLDRRNRAVLLMNERAIRRMANDIHYVRRLSKDIEDKNVPLDGTETELVYENGNDRRYLSIRAHEIEWEDTSAAIYAISDITDAKREKRELEGHAFRDSLTELHNRAYGMKILEEWIAAKRRFVLLFADLDSLKYINDVFGHNEGDLYIINAGKHLMAFPEDSVVCRLGGDEFMVIIPNVGYTEV